jgi:hypothetical protein
MIGAFLFVGRNVESSVAVIRQYSPLPPMIDARQVIIPAQLPHLLANPPCPA